MEAMGNKLRPSWATLAKLRPHWAKLRPKWGQLGSKMWPGWSPERLADWSILGPEEFQDKAGGSAFRLATNTKQPSGSSSWFKKWSQFGIKLGQVGRSGERIWTSWSQVGRSWSQIAPNWLKLGPEEPTEGT